MQQTEEYVKEADFEAQNSVGPTSFKDKLVSRLGRFLNSQYWIVVIIILVGCTSFLLGRISKMGEAREPVRVVSDNLQVATNNPLNPPYPKGEIGKNTSVSEIGQTASVGASSVESNVKVVGSKNGTKYHLESCPGAKQISEKNKIVFESIEEARSRGYTPASNCKGLK